MPAELKSQLEGAAAQNNRTVTAELVARLQASFSVVVSTNSDDKLGLGRSQEPLEDLVQQIKRAVQSIIDDRFSLETMNQQRHLIENQQKLLSNLERAISTLNKGNGHISSNRS
jgi:hypothetical protein